ncbi:MAG: stage III sporulation protein AE [Lachnospiraceae bacterium]|mgnify:FL=1|uniref:Stage III sporulation protein AE n=1 Tax=Candidatus Enterocloster excrementigallinarum TaxID=2838558 RepID=A0A9D2PRT3_9FIRM|nr:stage III sporulation protein AE [Lachnospiraceae bacterium]HJC65243.1 stage III sporulation protein AE [Candidatus Enterocloster excrementigallinarum]
MRATRVGACLLFLVCLLLGSGIEVKASWQQGQDSSQNDHAMSEIELLGIGEEVKEIENYLRQSLGEGQADFSFLSLMKSLLTGQFSQAAYEAGKGMKNSLLNEIEAGGGLLLQVVMIGIVGAVFSNFSSIFRGSHISETGFFVTYLLLFTCLAASFFASLQIAAKVLEQIFSFLRVLMPAYFMAVAFAGGSLSAAALYEVMMAAVTLVSWICKNILLPMVRIDVLLVLAGHVAKEETFTRMTELLEEAVGWILKTLTGLILGFHIIQSMVLPYADSAGQAGIRKLVELIPGVGSGANALTQVVLGSGVLIKNTMGAAAVAVLLILTLVPMAKLAVLMVLYQAAAAVMQPVCDRRVVSCVNGIAKGHKLLLKIVAASLILFILAIALTCAATNVNYYTI